jgi:hypothetical protein
LPVKSSTQFPKFVSILLELTTNDPGFTIISYNYSNLPYWHKICYLNVLINKTHLDRGFRLKYVIWRENRFMAKPFGMKGSIGQHRDERRKQDKTAAYQ